MKKDFNYCYYLVAFIDVLGQKDAFHGIEHLPDEDNKEQRGKLIKAHSQTVLFIEHLREGFEDFFNAYTEDKESKEKVPEEKKAQFDKMRKSVLKHQRFSDCIQAFVPLQSEAYHSNCINGVFGVLIACGGILLLSLASKKVFRAGIDVGIGTELTNGEVYGPALYNAYALESKIAQYPRIAIGNQLINYLMNLSHKNQQIPNQCKEDIELCKIMADNCLKMIVKDIDGKPILDYLGANFKNNISNCPMGEEKKSFDDILKMAYEFVENEYKRLKATDNSKLTLRYYLLYNYFKARGHRK